MTEAKTYTARNTRERSNGTFGTAPHNWVQSMLRKFPDATQVYKVRMTPYRYEPQHHQEDQLIDRIAEEKGTPGIPIDSADFADDMERLTDFDCRVNLDEQIIKASGALATYEIHLDDDVVKWVS